MITFKVLIKTILIATLAYVLQHIFPWWIIAIAGFLINFIIYSGGASSFLSGFLGVGMLWYFSALIVHVNYGTLLTDRIAQIFFLPGPGWLILVTALIGGLIGGFGGLTGSHLRVWVMPQESEIKF